MTTINGKQYNISFNLHAACLYERITKRNALEDVANFPSMELILTMGFCMILSSNQEEDTPDFDDYLKSIKFNETAPLLNDIKSSIRDFFNVLPGDNTGDTGSEDQDPNQ